MSVHVGRVLTRTSDMTTNASASCIHSVDESCTSTFYLLLIELLTLVLLVFGGAITGVVGIRRRNRSERQDAKVSTDT